MSIGNKAATTTYPRKSPILLRATSDERRRIRVAAAESDMSYLQLFLSLLDDRDRRVKRAANLAASPLHV